MSACASKSTSIAATHCRSPLKRSRRGAGSAIGGCWSSACISCFRGHIMPAIFKRLARPFAVLLLAVALGALAEPAHAEDFAVIVNKANTVEVDKALIARIYAGEVKSWR